MAEDLATYDEEFADALEALDRDFPRGWRWDEDGDTLTGYAVRVEQGQTKFGPCPILILNRKGEEVALWLMQTVLRNEMERKRPKVGDKIAVRFLGRAEGKDYDNFRVVVIPREGASLGWEEQPAIEAEIVDDKLPPSRDDTPHGGEYAAAEEPDWS